MKNPRINNKIIKIWDEHFRDTNKEYAPLFYNTFIKGGIAYSGLNPSFSESAFKRFLRDTEFESIQPTKFYQWARMKKRADFVDTCVSIDDLAQKNYSLYFKRPKEISENLKLPIQFLDLFQYRETNQEGFKKRIYSGSSLNKFATDQLDLFWKMLEIIEPQVILIANGFGSDLFKDYFADQLNWNERKGFHTLNLKKGSTPIFFSSMLTGQRSLDKSSYQRLIWHMKQAVKE